MGPRLVNLGEKELATSSRILRNELGAVGEGVGERAAQKVGKVGKVGGQIENRIFERNAKHIFRDAPGHLPDTPINRDLLNSTLSEGKNFLGRDRFGNDWFARTLSDGRQVWTSSRDGLIRNGGVNETPKVFHPNTGLSLGVGQ